MTDPHAILAIDGATNPGYALWHAGQWFTSTEWSDDLAEAVRELQPVVVVEAQYPNPNVGRDSLISLCARAWYQYGRACEAAGGAPARSATAAGWRGIIDAGWATLDKAAVLNRIWRRHGSGLPDRAGLTLDEQDAAGLAFSAIMSWRKGDFDARFKTWPELPKTKPRGARGGRARVGAQRRRK